MGIYFDNIPTPLLSNSTGAEEEISIYYRYKISLSLKKEGIREAFKAPVFVRDSPAH